MYAVYVLGFLDSSIGKESTCKAGDPRLVPGSGRSPGAGIGYPLWYSWTSLVAQLLKNRLQCWRPGFDPWFGKIPWGAEPEYQHLSPHPTVSLENPEVQSEVPEVEVPGELSSSF